jgi:hypothetical protein
MTTAAQTDLIKIVIDPVSRQSSSERPDDSVTVRIQAIAPTEINASAAKPVPTWREIGRMMVPDYTKWAKGGLWFGGAMADVFKTFATDMWGMTESSRNALKAHAASKFQAYMESEKGQADMRAVFTFAVDVFLDKEVQKNNAKNEKIIASLPFGGVAAAQFIKSMAPKLVELIEPLHPSTMALCQARGKELAYAMETALLQIGVNLIKCTGKENPTLLDVAALWTKSVDADIGLQLRKAELAGDEAEKQRLLNKAFTPILDLALPNGPKDVGIRDGAIGGLLSKLVWDQLSSRKTLPYWPFKDTVP